MSVTIEYRCAKCKGKTPPPVPPKSFVLCPCGYMTSAPAAERIIRCASSDDFEDGSSYSPYAACYIHTGNIETLNQLGSHGHSWLTTNTYWLNKKTTNLVTPLYGQEYVSGLVEEINRLQGRVTMVESYEDECLRLLREAEAERDALREQLVRAGINPEPIKSKDSQ